VGGGVPDVPAAVRQALSTGVPTTGTRLLRRPDILLRHRYSLRRNDPSTSPLEVSPQSRMYIIEASLNIVHLSAD